MDSIRFDGLTRSVSTLFSRRTLAGALGLGALAHPGPAEAKKKHKHKKKKTTKLKRNAFGCVDVGGACRGSGGNCCSGLCEGKKPKKGKKDTSVCVAHNDAGICFADTDSCAVGSSVSCNADNASCDCVQTTGKAGFCGDFTAGAADLCRICSQDTDCQEEFGGGAACVLLGESCTPLCVSTGRTACVPPCAA